MLRYYFQAFVAVLVAPLVAPLAFAQAGGAGGLQKDRPIEISSDKLDVLQAEHKAIFSGNVIAVQGTTNMRAAQMVVFYRDNNKAQAAAPAPTEGQGIYRIEATGNVVFTTPAETAIGDKAIYNVDADTIDLVGSNVTLTRGQNILKGNAMNYNMTTGRSVLTGGSSGVAASSGGGSKPARVHGLFVPKSEPKPASKP